MVSQYSIQGPWLVAGGGFWMEIGGSGPGWIPPKIVLRKKKKRREMGVKTLKDKKLFFTFLSLCSFIFSPFFFYFFLHLIILFYFILFHLSCKQIYPGSSAFYPHFHPWLTQDFSFDGGGPKQIVRFWG